VLLELEETSSLFVWCYEGARWWCFTIVSPCIAKDGKHEQNHTQIRLRLLNEQMTVS
jgi:hypothetical protein